MARARRLDLQAIALAFCNFLSICWAKKKVGLFLHIYIFLITHQVVKACRRKSISTMFITTEFCGSASCSLASAFIKMEIQFSTMLSGLEIASSWQDFIVSHFSCPTWSSHFLFSLCHFFLIRQRWKPWRFYHCIVQVDGKFATRKKAFIQIIWLKIFSNFKSRLSICFWDRMTFLQVFFLS